MTKTNFHRKRTTCPTPEKITYSIPDEPLILSKALLDLFLKEKKYSNLLALYSFYYYTAKWQRTNQPKATTEYVAKGLGWCVARVIETKKKLTEFKLIEDIIKKDSYGKITGYYIQLNFIFHQSTGFSSPGKTDREILENLIEEKKKNNMSDLKNRTKKHLPLAQHLSDTIHIKKNIFHSAQQIHSWSEDIRKLVEGNKVSYERIDKALQWYRNNIGREYVPVIESGYSLKNKFSKLEDAMNRKDYSLSDKPKRITREGEFWFLRDNGNYYNQKGILYR